jgi:ABC-2 type transport system ATP-binding protein
VAILRNGRIAFHGELDELKDRVKRLRIAASRDLPASFAIPGALHCEINGPLATVSVDDFDDELLKNVRQTWQADVSVEDLNLEEIFLELHDQSDDARLAATRWGSGPDKPLLRE